MQGASLEIARLWLEKARKRRAFSKLITGIIEANKDDHCHITGRTEMMGAKLVVTLATKGEVDEQAIDRLIAEVDGPPLVVAAPVVCVGGSCCTGVLETNCGVPRQSAWLFLSAAAAAAAAAAATVATSLYCCNVVSLYRST